MFKRRVLLSLFLFLVFISISEQYTLRLQSSDESNELRQISKREAEENVSEEETTANVDEAGAEEETVVPEETQPSAVADANDSAEKEIEEAKVESETNAEETSQEADAVEETPATSAETKSEEAQAEAEAAETQSETSTEAQIEAPTNDETQDNAESSAESLTKDNETIQAQSEEKEADVAPETASAALVEASGQSGASQETSSDDGSGQEEEVLAETTTELDKIVVSPEDNLPTDGVDEYEKENNVTLPVDTEGSGSSEYEENKDFDPKGKGGELPAAVSGEDDDGSGDEDTHEPVTTEKPIKDLDDDDDSDEEEKKNVWFKPSGEFTVAENDQYLENIKKCPNLQCEYGFRIDWDDRPNCDCFNPCNEINCGSDVCIVEQTGNNRFKGVCHTKEAIDQKVKDGKPLHCHKPRPKPEVCRKKHYTSRFFYNITGSRCEHFIYTSCTAEPDANKYDNHFLTWETCQMECHTCNLPAERGPCKANVLRYFYDPASKECKGFSWGGCQGNENNFATRRHCEDSCVRRVEGALFLNGMPVRKIRIYNSGGDIFNKKN